MVRFRYSAFSIVLLIGCASCFTGCASSSNRSFPNQPGGTPNLVQDGGFEHPRITSFEYDSYSAGQPLDMWTIDAGAVDQLSGRVWSPAEGVQSLDMDGSCGTGTICQDLSTKAGISYDLRFALAGNPNGPPVVKQLEVSWGDAVVDTVRFDTTGGSKRYPGWVSYSYTLIAASGSTRLTFRSLSPGCYGAMLDAVSVKKTPSI